MPRVYLSVGSNVSPETHLPSALAALRAHFGELNVSRILRSAAVGFAGADFLNLAVGFDTARPPVEVARILRQVEAQHGRDRRRPAFSSRALDLDLLLYGDLVMDRDGVRVPREDITRYGFVLAPLAEIAGAERHPLTGRRYDEMWRDFDGPGKVLRPVEIEEELAAVGTRPSDIRDSGG